MKVTCLIPASRPTLFPRCLNSVVSRPCFDKIIVNTEFFWKNEYSNVVHYQKQFNPWSKVYKFLFKQAKNKFVWFLEDDDLCIRDIMLSYKTNSVYYLPFIPAHDKTTYVKAIAPLLGKIISKEEFLIYMMRTSFYQFFQLSSVVFNKSALSEELIPEDDFVFNDFLMFCLDKSENVIILNDFIWQQTFDDPNRVSTELFGKPYSYETEYDTYLAIIKEVYGERMYHLCSP